jgi:cell division septal protein FtsQ
MKDYSADYFKKTEQRKQKKHYLPKFKLTRWGPILLITCTLTCMIFLLINVHRLIYAPPETLYIGGNRIIPKGDLLSRLAITDDQIWNDLDPYALSLKLNQHPWIRTSIVRRVVPLGIEVQVVERKPIAYLHSGSKLFLIDQEGWVLKKPKIAMVWDLPVITLNRTQNFRAGQHIQTAILKNILKLMEILRNSSVLPLATISEIDGRNPLNIELTTIPYGTKIKIGYTRFKLALQKLKLALTVISSQGKRRKIKYIDLRQLGGVAFKKATWKR